MNNYTIITDSSCDLPDSLVKELELEVLPLWSMVPTTAVAADTRPPFFRKNRSFTVNQWHWFSLFCSAQSRT